MRKEQFVQGEYYHIYNRGVEKRRIFTSDQERIRFIHTIYILNNFLQIPPRFDIFSLEPRKNLVPIPPYVEIVAACLMPNHYHLLLTPKQEKGVSRFLHKIGSGYAHYFNIRHKRSGRLFESTFKAKHVDRYEYAAYLTQYIHLNPMDLFPAKQGTEVMLTQIKDYPWSTLPIYLGKQSPFSPISSAEFRSKVLDMNKDAYMALFEEMYKNRYPA